MGIWIDPPDTAAHGRVWSHLISDSSTEELHDFAARVGIPRRGFDGDHYDVPAQWYDAMIEAGAQPASAADLVRKLHHAGLRLRKRKGEHGIAVVPRVVFADQGVADVDLIASSQLAIEARVFCATVFVQDSAGDFAVVFSHRRNEWGPPGGWREGDEAPLATAVRETLEETGLVLRPEAVVPIGYERFRNRSGGHLWHPTGDLMQVFGARLDSVRLALIDDDDGIGGVEWVRFTQFRERCGELFWWPLAEHLFGAPLEG